MQTITILGSTGSIGGNTLDVISQNPADFHIYALTANSNVEALLAQCIAWRPVYAVMTDTQAADTLARELEQRHLTDIIVLSGQDGLCQVARAPEVDTVMAAIVGIAGLSSAYAAAKAGKKILLANKESLVTAGHLFMDAVQTNGATLIPVDSEHNAIFQCLPEDHPYYDERKIDEVILTASGGPFRTKNINELSNVTPDQACAHPNWTMGQKISVDSATMMNKALEVIEAHWLFQVPVDKLSVLIHPQSIIHSMVKYTDGSYLAQLGSPDMRTPIAHSLYYPGRGKVNAQPLDLTSHSLTFEHVNQERFPAIAAVYELLRKRDYAGMVIFNAMNELMVEQFLHSQIRFTDIVANVVSSVHNHSYSYPETIEEVILLDKKIRSCVTSTH